jgi:hypothetical protein
MSRRYPDIKPLHDHPLAKAASEAGGVLIGADLKMELGPNGGCGAPTHVEGTNGGTVPCGSFVSRLGERNPYYCGLCTMEMNKSKHLKENPTTRSTM